MGTQQSHVLSGLRVFVVNAVSPTGVQAREIMCQIIGCLVQEGHTPGDAGGARALAEHVQATLMVPVEQLLLVDYPLRSPPAADADDPGSGFKLDEVSVSLKVVFDAWVRSSERWTSHDVT